MHVVSGLGGGNRKRIGKMWKLKIGEGGKGVISVNNNVGRQHWVFDPNAGSVEEREEVERLRHQFTLNRFSIKQSADLFLRMQVSYRILLLQQRRKNHFTPEQIQRLVQFLERSTSNHNIDKTKFKV